MAQQKAGAAIVIMFDGVYGGLNENDPHFTDSQGVALLGGVGLLEEVCHCGGELWSFRSSNQAQSHSLFLRLPIQL